MALAVAVDNISIWPVSNYVYQITGIINGANSIVLPTPPAAGSFPPDGSWTPSVILPFPYAIGAIAPYMSVDYTTVANSNGAVTFTLYSNGSGAAIVVCQ